MVVIIYGKDFTGINCEVVKLVIVVIEVESSITLLDSSLNELITVHFGSVITLEEEATRKTDLNYKD